MSNVSTAHNVLAFDAKKSQPLTGQRLAKVRYKSTEKQAARFPSVCVSVPFIKEEDIDNTVVISRLMPHIRGMLEAAQDGVIRSLYESADGMLSSVTDGDISIEACIKFLEAEAQGSRLTKEFIEAWFVGTLQDYVFALVAEKLGYCAGTDTEVELTVEQEHTVNKHVNGYKGLYSSLAGGKTVLQDAQAKSLLRVLELVDSGDDTAEKLKGRLVSMMQKPKLEELLEL
jgi:hypothetical protein